MLRSQRRGLRVESLENRAMLAGDVTVSVNGGTLLITGDNAANNILVFGNAQAGSYTITANGGTVNKGAGPVTVTGVKYDAVINLNDGADTLLVDGNFPKSLVINGHGGADNVTVTGVNTALRSVGGSLIVDLGAGDDTYFEGPLNIAGVNQIFGQTGNDNITVDGRNPNPAVANSSITVNGAFLVDAGLDNDSVNVNKVRVNNNNTLVVVGSNGDDRLIVDASIAYSIVVDGGIGNDTMFLRGSAATQDAVVVGSDGDDTITVANVTAKNGVVDAGAGRDNVSVSGARLNYATVVLGAGDDTLTLTDNIVTNTATLDGGPGVNTLIDGGANSFGKLNKYNFKA